MLSPRRSCDPRDLDCRAFARSGAADNALAPGFTILDDPGQYLRAREGECELGTLAIGKRCQERISATGWAWFAESALDTLYVARKGLMVRGSPAATGYRPTRQTRGLYKGGSTS
jgi:hypothetical protein